MGDAHGRERRRPGTRQQRRIPDGALRGAGPRLVSERDLLPWPGRRCLQAIRAAGECFAQARRMAGVRHHLPRPEIRRAGKSRRPGAGHGAPQRRAHSEQRRDLRAALSRPSRALHRALTAGIAAVAGPRQPGALPEYLDQAVVEASFFRGARRLVLQPARLGELFHHAFLILGELFRDLNRDFHDQVALLVSLLDPLPTHAEPFSGRSPRRNPQRHLFPIQGAYADLRAKCGLRDVERDRCNDIESVAPVDFVRLNIEGDDEIAGWPVARSLAALSLQSNLPTGVDARRHIDQHLATSSDLAVAMTRWAGLARHLTAAKTNRTWAVDREPALAKRDHAASAALRTNFECRARRRSVAMACRTFLAHF